MAQMAGKANSIGLISKLQLRQHVINTQIMVDGHFTEDGPQGAGLQWIVGRNRDVMLWT